MFVFEVAPFADGYKGALLPEKQMARSKWSYRTASHCDGCPFISCLRIGHVSSNQPNLDWKAVNHNGSLNLLTFA